jgi:amphi-Trp domain-containing protein
MPKRDVESIRSKKKFVALLRRVADSIENGEAVRIQVARKRFEVPAAARLSVEHEISGTSEELELQLKWRRT